MPFIIRCVKCQRRLRVLDRLAGKLVKCPACQTKFVAQMAGSAAAAKAPALARPAGPSGSRTVPRPPSSKVPLSRPAPSAPPSSKVPTGPRSRVQQAVRPPEEAMVDYGEEEFMPASGAIRSRPRPLDDLEPPPPSSVSKSGVRRPLQTPFMNVFATLGGVLLLTAIFGLATAWWVNSRVQFLQGSVPTGKR
jgi:hypothetical protein